MEVKFNYITNEILKAISETEEELKIALAWLRKKINGQMPKNAISETRPATNHRVGSPRRPFSSKF